MASAVEVQARQPVDVEVALGSVRAASGHRQKVQIVAIGLTATLALLAVLSLDEFGRFLSMEREIPPAERDIEDSRVPDLKPDRDRDVTTKFETDLGGTSSVTRTPNGRSSDPSRAGRWSATGGSQVGGTIEEPPAVEPRIVQGPYQTTSDPFTDAHGCWSARLTCRVEFQARANERWISVAIVDSGRRQMSGEIRADWDGDGEPDSDGIEFCGETSPIMIPAGSPIYVQVIGPGCKWMGGASSGHVQMTFWTSRPV